MPGSLLATSALLEKQLWSFCKCYQIHLVTWYWRFPFGIGWTESAIMTLLLSYITDTRGITFVIFINDNGETLSGSVQTLFSAHLCLSPLRIRPGMRLTLPVNHYMHATIHHLASHRKKECHWRFAKDLLQSLTLTNFAYCSASTPKGHCSKGHQNRYPMKMAPAPI